MTMTTVVTVTVTAMMTTVYDDDDSVWGGRGFRVGLGLGLANPSYILYHSS